MYSSVQHNFAAQVLFNARFLPIVQLAFADQDAGDLYSGSAEADYSSTGPDSTALSSAAAEGLPCFSILVPDSGPPEKKKFDDEPAVSPALHDVNMTDKGELQLDIGERCSASTGSETAFILGSLQRITTTHLHRTAADVSPAPRSDSNSNCCRWIAPIPIRASDTIELLSSDQRVHSPSTQKTSSGQHGIQVERARNGEASRRKYRWMDMKEFHRCDKMWIMEGKAAGTHHGTANQPDAVSPPDENRVRGEWSKGAYAAASAGVIGDGGRGRRRKGVGSGAKGLTWRGFREGRDGLVSCRLLVGSWKSTARRRMKRRVYPTRRTCAHVLVIAEGTREIKPARSTECGKDEEPHSDVGARHPREAREPPVVARHQHKGHERYRIRSLVSFGLNCSAKKGARLSKTLPLTGLRPAFDPYKYEARNEEGHRPPTHSSLRKKPEIPGPRQVALRRRERKEEKKRKRGKEGAAAAPAHDGMQSRDASTREDERCTSIAQRRLSAAPRRGSRQGPPTTSRAPAKNAYRRSEKHTARTKTCSLGTHPLAESKALNARARQRCSRASASPNAQRKCGAHAHPAQRGKVEVALPCAGNVGKEQVGKEGVEEDGGESKGGMKRGKQEGMRRSDWRAWMMDAMVEFSPPHAEDACGGDRKQTAVASSASALGPQRRTSVAAHVDHGRCSRWEGRSLTTSRRGPVERGGRGRAVAVAVPRLLPKSSAAA
ncbi:hypothetical protein C8R46DRAFT_1199630 [Mycena filopes]|nr:hypothetical protein C8R46DRAFT_1199630 [Mycena filopes]